MRPRRSFVHEGSVERAAILVPAGDEGRRRALEAWEPGVVVSEAAARSEGGRRPIGWFVRFATARRILVVRATGLPFVASKTPRGDVVTSFPPAASDLDPLGAGTYWADGGTVQPIELAPVDVASWIDVAGWSTEIVRPLSAPLVAPRARLEHGPVAARAVFGSAVPDQDPEGAAISDVIRGRAAGSPYRDAAAPLAAALEARMKRAVAVVSAVLTWVGPRATAPTEGDDGKGAAVAKRQDPRRSLTARIAAFVARALVAMGLAEEVERRHQAYVNRLFEMLDGDDLDEALRHAIQLGDGKGPPRPIALGTPGPRARLHIRPTATSATTTIATQVDDLYERLKKKYRAAFERLEKQGEIEKAAFVLAELLHEDREAVAFLERHGRLRLAAELAEGRRLPASLVVRAWLLAGEPERALAIAKAKGAFSIAVSEMEASEDERVRALAPRAAWAEHLAKAGDFAGAVEVLYGRPALSAEGVVQSWIEAAIAQGGASRARVLPLAIADASTPERGASARASLADVLGHDGAEAHEERRVLARSLLARPSFTPLARAAARGLVRALTADAGRWGRPDLAGLVDGLVTFAEDAALAADRPKPQAPPRVEPLTAVVGADDRGVAEALDAALLPHGQTLVALGAAGVAVLGRDGRVRARYPLPAEHLVVSDRGDRVITVASCGGRIHRLGRIDFATGRAEAWREAELGAFARDFDGASWLVGVGKELRMIDAGADGLEVSYAFACDGDVLAIARHASGCHVVAREAFGPGAESLEFGADWVLRARVAADDDVKGGVALGPTGATAALDVTAPAEGGERAIARLRDATRAARHIVPIGHAGERAVDVAMSDAWLASVLVGADGVRIDVTSIQTFAFAGELRLLGATAAGARVMPRAIVAWDDRGRVLAFDPALGALVRDVRV